MANIKITDLTAYTDPDTTDVLPIVDVGADVTKKVAVGEVVGKITGDVDVATDGTSSIASGAIVDADVNASAAIAGTKIDPDFGSQTVETTGDLAINTDTLFVDVSANAVGVGTTTVEAKCHVEDTSNTTVRIKNASTSTGSTARLDLATTTGSGTSARIEAERTGGAVDLKFYSSPSNGVISGEGFRLDGSGRLLVGTSSARTNYNNSTAYGPILNLEGTLNSNRVLSFIHNDSSGGPFLVLGSTGGSAAGSNTLVAAQSTLGFLSFQGADGTDLVEAAQIKAQVDGTPGADDMPGRLVFSTTADGASSPTPRVQINSSGTLQLLSGCPGIDFSGIQTNAAGMTSETLDSYEEGTFTPTIVGTTTAGTGTYATQIGRYIKVGRQVHCAGTLIWTAHDGTGNMRIEGLPFSALNVSELFNAAVFSYVANLTMPANTILMGDLQNNSSKINLRSAATGGGTPSSLAIDSAANIYFSITYQVD